MLFCVCVFFLIDLDSYAIYLIVAVTHDRFLLITDCIVLRFLIAIDGIPSMIFIKISVFW